MRITQLAFENGSITDDWNVRLNLEVFQAGKYVLDINDQNSGKVPLYEQDSWSNSMQQKQALDQVYGDDERNPEFAMRNAINRVAQTYAQSQ